LPHAPGRVGLGQISLPRLPGRVGVEARPAVYAGWRLDPHPALPQRRREKIRGPPPQGGTEQGLAWAERPLGCGGPAPRPPRCRMIAAASADSSVRVPAPPAVAAPALEGPPAAAR